MVKVFITATLCVCGAAQTVPTVYTVLDLPDIKGVPLLRPVGPIRAGSMPIRLEHTTLTQLKQRFGGRVQEGGQTADAVAWICYRATDPVGRPLIFWFGSNLEMSRGSSISEVAVQLAPASPVPANCNEAPASLTGISFGLPAIGATQDSIGQRLGPTKPDSKGFVVYTHESPLPRHCTESSRVTYRIENASVKLIAVSQVSSC